MERKILFKVKSGSHMYGLNTPESDEDYMGIFMPTSEDLLGLNKLEEIDNSTKSSKEDRRNTKEDVDEKLYSLKKYLHLALQNNPNIVEVLFSSPESIIEMTPVFQELIDNRDKIVSQKIYYSFTGYAFAQRKKLIVKKERYTSLVEGVKFLETVYKDKLGSKYPIKDEDADALNTSLKYYKGKKNNTESFHRGMDLDMIIEKLRAERDRYGWRVNTSTFEKLFYDVKFAYHLIRLLGQGEQLLETGKIDFPITGKLKDDIMRIRNGEVEYDELMKMYETYNKRCDVAFENTKLRKTPDFKWANKWLIKILKESIINEEE